jgi:hypothetical protein
VNGFGIVAAVLAVAIGVVAFVAAARALPRLTFIERVVLAWWVAIAVVAFSAVPLERARPVLIPLAGAMMMGLGVIGVLNYGGVADRLAARRTGIGPFWQQQSSASWRLFAGFLVVIGLFWTFGSLVG